MGKSAKKFATKVVDVVPAAVALKKGKRDAEEAIEKVSKKQKTAAAAAEQAKALKKVPKKQESSSSEEESSSDDEPPKVVAPVKKVVAPAKPVKDSSSSEEDSSSDDEPKKKPVVAAKAKPAKESSSSEDSDDSSSDDEPKSKVAAPAKSAPAVAVKNGTVAASKKKDESSDDSDSSDESDSDSDEEEKVKVTSQPKKVSATATKKEDDSDESSDDESDEEESSDEEEKPVKTPKKTDTDVEMVDAPSAKKAPQTPATPQAGGGSKTLFVGNLSFSVEQADIENFFKDAGEVVDVRFASDRETGQFRGYGHVEFATAEAAQKALKLNGHDLLGREIRLDLAKERGAYTPTSGKENSFGGGRAQGQTVYVRGFDTNDGEDNVRSALEKHFGTCGEITRVSIPSDRDTGSLKGFAYIDFSDGGAFNKALEFDGSDFGGYPLTVNEAKPKGDFGGGGGRSGGGGGWSGGGGRSGGRRGGGRFGDSGGGRRGGRDSGGRRGGGRGRGPSRPSMATPGTGKKTTFD